jgi:putative transposase
MTRDIDAVRDDQWEWLKGLVPDSRAGERGPRCDNPRFVDALLRMTRSGGRSHGGLSTKIHAATDALGNPVRLLFGPVQHNDITQAHDLTEGFKPEAIVAEGYDANHLRDAIRANEAEPVIPPKSNRRVPITYDKARYTERNLVERFFNQLKQFRRVATRYDKLPANHRGCVILAAIAISLK